MATRPPVMPLWIEVWLVLSGIICSLDVIYTMLRPHTNKGGQLENIYYGWNLYASVDVRYADMKDIVTCATGRVMVIEILMDFFAFYLARIRSRHALLMTFTSTAFVFWKTVWYLTLYVNPPGGNPSYFTEDSSMLKIFIIFWIPNGIWVIMPFIVLCSLWNRLALPVEVEEKYSTCNSEIA